jgi:hypothetical protein
LDLPRQLRGLEGRLYTELFAQKSPELCVLAQRVGAASRSEMTAHDASVYVLAQWVDVHDPIVHLGRPARVAGCVQHIRKPFENHQVNSLEALALDQAPFRIKAIQQRTRVQQVAQPEIVEASDIQPAV